MWKWKIFRNHNGKQYQICQQEDLLLVLESSDHFFIQSVAMMVTQGKIQIDILARIELTRPAVESVCPPYVADNIRIL